VATVYVQDRFRGSGNLVGSYPDAYAAGLGAWGGSATTEVVRTASGITLAGGSGPVSATLTDGTTTLGTGVFVVEVDTRGPCTLAVLMDAGGANYQATIDRMNATLDPIYDEGGSSGNIGGELLSGGDVGWGGSIVLRVEITTTTFKAFARGVQLGSTWTWTTPLTTSSPITVAGLLFNEYTASTALTAAYIHAVRETTSGALGEPIGTVYPATSIDPTTAFGTPTAPPIALTVAPTAEFGLPRAAVAYGATAVAPETQFGTGALTLNTARAAATIEPTILFGSTAAAAGFILTLPGYAEWIAPTTQFGRPAITKALHADATGWASSNVPAPMVRLPSVASGFVSGGMGEHGLFAAQNATGFRGTTFGAVSSLILVSAAGMCRTQLGVLSSQCRGSFEANSLMDTTFGTPDATKNTQRLRGNLFRTSFGRAQAERTAP